MEMNTRAVALLMLLLTFCSFALPLFGREQPALAAFQIDHSVFEAPKAEGGLLFTSLLDGVAVLHPSPAATLVIGEIITPVLAGRILAMSDASLGLVELDTIGGDVQSAIAIANRLRDAGSHTHVSAGARCFSACAVIYQGGFVRSADEDALFLLHYAVQYSNDPGHARVGSIWGTVALIEEMIDLGVDPRIYDQMPGYGDWLLSARQAGELGLVQYVGSANEARRDLQMKSVRAWTSWGQS